MKIFFSLVACVLLIGSLELPALADCTGACKGKAEVSLFFEGLDCASVDPAIAALYQAAVISAAQNAAQASADAQCANGCGCIGFLFFTFEATDEGSDCVYTATAKIGNNVPASCQ